MLIGTPTDTNDFVAFQFQEAPSWVNILHEDLVPGCFQWKLITMVGLPGMAMLVLVIIKPTSLASSWELVMMTPSEFYVCHSC